MMRTSRSEDQLKCERSGRRIARDWNRDQAGMRTEKLAKTADCKRLTVDAVRARFAADEGRPGMRRLSRLILAGVWLLVLPSAAFAQASITGVVRDPSGAVLPGVTVEASSPALIEKVRSVVTDGSGQYRIVTLPPGAY